MLSKKDPRRITIDTQSNSDYQESKPITGKQFKKLEDEVFAYWPTAKHVPIDAKTLSVFEHSERLVWKNPVQKTEKRREEFRTYLKTVIEPLLGKEVAESVYTQLGSNHSIATGPHYSPLSPKTLNPILQMSLAYFNRDEPARQNILVLACSGISFNNHWYPRGHIFHSLVGEKIVELQLNFVGRVFDADPVVTHKAYSLDLKKVLLKTINHLRSEKQIKKRELGQITQLINEHLFTKGVLSQKYFIDQLTILNFHLWKKLFSTHTGHVPNLIFLSQEKIAAQLLEKFHMNTDTELGHIIFDTKWHELIYKHFENIQCAFSLKRQYGTFLFWATPKNTTNRIQLFAKNGVLESPDGTIKIPLTPEEIKKRLINEEITPSTMLTFLVLSLYYGFSLTGGLDQPTYLTQTKEAYLNMLKELGLAEEAENYKPIVTNDILFTRPTLAFLDGPDGQRIPASLLDLLLHGVSSSWEKVLQATKEVTKLEILYRLYPELYRDYCEKDIKDEELIKITERDIERYTKLDKKIPAWTTLQNS